VFHDLSWLVGGGGRKKRGWKILNQINLDLPQLSFKADAKFNQPQTQQQLKTTCSWLAKASLTLISQKINYRANLSGVLQNCVSAKKQNGVAKSMRSHGFVEK
jgi:hypothetical protein